MRPLSTRQETMVGVGGVGAGSSCVGGVLDAVNELCYTYHSDVKTRLDAAASCRIAGSQLVSVEVGFNYFHCAVSNDN